MSDTRHLDTAIRILGGGAPKANKPSTVEVSVHTDPGTGWYQVQVGSRIVHEGQGSQDEAREAGQRKVAALKAKGMRATLTVY